MTGNFKEKMSLGEIKIDVKFVNTFTTTFTLYQGEIEIGICDVTIRELYDNEKEYIYNTIKDYKISNPNTYNINWIEIYKDKINFYESYKGIGTFFLNYCINYLIRNSKNKIHFSTLDNCIDHKCSESYNKIYFYKRLGYEWIYFDEVENKPSGPEMIKFL